MPILLFKFGLLIFFKGDSLASFTAKILRKYIIEKLQAVLIRNKNQHTVF